MICRDGSGYPSTACNFGMKPASRQPCTGLICNEVEKRGETRLVEAARQKKTAPSEKEDKEVETAEKEAQVCVVSGNFGK